MKTEHKSGVESSSRVLTKAPESEELEKLRALATHWQSDLKFYQDEVRFLYNLIVKYFMWLSEEENLSKTKLIAKELAHLEIQRKVCEKETDQHIWHFNGLVENPFSHESGKFKEEHARLEDEFAAFVKQFRSIKQETFRLTEGVIETEKVKHLIMKSEN